MPTYTNPKDGKIIESSLLSATARDIIKQHAPQSDGFAHDLARKNMLSPSQIYWLIVKAENYNPANINKTAKQNPIGIIVGAGFKRIHDMFQLAKLAIKRPKIKLFNMSDAIEISMAPDTGRNAGFIYIKNNKEYAGKISPEGEFFPVPQCLPATKEYIKDFAENPELVAAKYGRETGNCCFCSRLLTDNRSVTVGYGPICAERFGLTWG